VSSSLGPAGDAGKQRLIESHLPLVRAVARRYLGRGEELEDLAQVGAIGLIKAADRFEPERGVAFGTFATTVIEGEIRHHLRDRAGSLRIPRELQQLGAKVRRSHEQLAATLGRSPTVGELAAALCVDSSEVERALVAERARDPLPISPDESELAPAATELEGSDDRLLLTSGARVLDERERRIVLLRFHADLTERQIAQEMGLSQAHVSRLLSGALTKLRAELASADDSAGTGDITVNTVISGDSGSRGGPMGPGHERDSSRQEGQAAGRRASSGHSGRFLVRMPSTLHEELARAAEQQHVSLNRFVTDTLAASVAAPRVAEPVDDEPASSADRAIDRDPSSGPAGSIEEQPEQRPRPRSLRVALATNVVIVVVAGLIAIVLLVLALERGI